MGGGGDGLVMWTACSTPWRMAILKHPAAILLPFSPLARCGIKSSAQRRVIHITPAASSIRTVGERGQQPRSVRYRLPVDTPDYMDSVSADAGDDGYRTRAIDPELLQSP